MAGNLRQIAAQSGIRGVNGHSSIRLDEGARREGAAENVEEATLCSRRRAGLRLGAERGGSRLAAARGNQASALR
jgi:hypothetical protein